MSAPNSPFAHYRLLDLTHFLNSSVPTWEGYCGFQHHVLLDYNNGCRVQSVHMRSGPGTHIDAPAHFIPDGMDVADIPLEELIAPLCVIDVSKKAHADYYITRDDILEFERRHGKIIGKSLVVGYTGWDRYWQTEKFRNVDVNGQMHFPGFSPESAKYLLEKNIVGIGIDTLSPDCLDLTFPVHHLILGAGKYIIENLANCSQLPVIGSYAMVLPLKAQGITESPVRAVGLIPTPVKSIQG